MYGTTAPTGASTSALPRSIGSAYSRRSWRVATPLSLDYGKAALLSVISVGKETLDLKGRVAALERENRKLKELISTGNL